MYCPLQLQYINNTQKNYYFNFILSFLTIHFYIFFQCVSKHPQRPWLLPYIHKDAVTYFSSIVVKSLHFWVMFTAEYAVKILNYSSVFADFDIKFYKINLGYSSCSAYFHHKIRQARRVCSNNISLQTLICAIHPGSFAFGFGLYSPLIR